jgi:Flp pilus assembly protein TadD
MMLSALGRHDEAAAAYRRARARDPLATVLRTNFAMSRILAREYDEAEREARLMIDSGMDARHLLAWALAWQGRVDGRSPPSRRWLPKRLGHSQGRHHQEASTYSRGW